MKIDYSQLSASELKQKTIEFKQRISEGSALEQILPEAFAAVREASTRALGLRHFKVQLIGGIILHEGMIAEMKTGEGKTLVATLAAYLNSLSGLGVHLVTVNDYLAKRDAEWMGGIYDALGVSVNYVVNTSTPQERRVAYQADITYCTNNELGFDYLRDNMCFSEEERVQRGHHYAIIDEADSILIDESRTPLIISGQSTSNAALYKQINKIAELVVAEVDYEIDEKSRNLSLTEAGFLKVEQFLHKSRLLAANASAYDIDNAHLLHYINLALKAHNFFLRDRDYIIKQGRLLIIDEFTGRILEGRRYSEGLHQALEAKEGIRIQDESQTLASTTFQNYFKMYSKLAGMTGTAATEAEELYAIYRLPVVSIPTNVPIARADENDSIYASSEEKYRAVIELLKNCLERSQPALVGTLSIEQSEKLSKMLKENKISHQVLNARYHDKEAAIIAQAGRSGSVTIATNMAGRGTDIQLGGNADFMLKESKGEKNLEQIKEEISQDRAKVIEAGGLYVIGTERHENRRIDNQLRGRAGRQGDPGRSKFFLSLDDDLLRIFLSEKIKVILQKIGLKKDEAITHPLINNAIEKAQRKRESLSYEVRKALLRFDDVFNSQRNIVYGYRREILKGNLNDLGAIAHRVNARILSAAPSEDLIPYLHSELHKIYNSDFCCQDVEVGDLSNHALKAWLDEKSSQAIIAKEQILSEDESIIQSVKRRIMLMSLDMLWREHLTILEDIRVSINLRAIGQKDPVNEFKREAFALFQKLLKEWDEMTISYFMHSRLEGR